MKGKLVANVEAIQLAREWPRLRAGRALSCPSYSGHWPNMVPTYRLFASYSRTMDRQDGWRTESAKGRHAESHQNAARQRGAKSGRSRHVDSGVRPKMLLAVRRRASGPMAAAILCVRDTQAVTTELGLGSRPKAATQRRCHSARRDGYAPPRRRYTAHRLRRSPSCKVPISSW